MDVLEGHGLPFRFESLPRRDHDLGLLGKYLVWIGNTAVDLLFRQFQVLKGSLKCS